MSPSSDGRLHFRSLDLLDDSMRSPGQNDMSEMDMEDLQEDSFLSGTLEKLNFFDSSIGGSIFVMHCKNPCPHVMVKI